MNSPRINRHPSWVLCRELTGGHLTGNVGDLADIVAQVIECVEDSPRELPVHHPTLADAHHAISRIRGVLDRAEQRLKDLES